MDVFIVSGGKPLVGTIEIGGAKNVALKACVASLLTDDELTLHNMPVIQDVSFMLEVLESLGVGVERRGHTVRVKNGSLSSTTVPLEVGARLRTSVLVLGPMLARFGQARVPNPGGCRIGARPIDRHVEGLTHMGARITYNSSDGYFHATAQKLHGTTYRFPKNTHTGTETMILAAVLAEGQTTLENAAEEVEVDDLISLLRVMGAKIERIAPRTIVVTGVPSLQGASYTIMPDRNEEVTFALAAAVTKGRIIVKNSKLGSINAFAKLFTKAGGVVRAIDEATTEYSVGKRIVPVDVVTSPHPGFMTDWQAPWCLFMTQADGESCIHESVFESRFSYVSELQKMGANIEFFDPTVKNPESFYNFNWMDRLPDAHQAIRIGGPTRLHNAVVRMADLRAGATLLLATLAASGESYIHGVEQIDRGYENIEERLTELGANIARKKEGHL